MLAMGIRTGQPNLQLANLVRNSRLDLDMSQQDLATAMDKSRHWIAQLERGSWYKDGKAFTLDGDSALRLAMTLNLDPVGVLRAGQVEVSRWPDLSKLRSEHTSVRTVDISSLTPQKQDLVERLVEELKYATSEDRRPESAPRSRRRATRKAHDSKQ